MLGIILASISFFSLFGILLILFRKMPLLVKLPEGNSIWELLTPEIKKGLAKIPGAKNIDYELYLQKMLSKARVLTMKVEGKTGNWLERLRQRRNGHNHDSEYWEELKNAKDGK